MKKLLLTIALLTLFVCLFAVSVSAASTVYRDTEGNVLFTAQNSDTDRVFASYEGSFPNFDQSGNALTWYVTGKEDIGDTQYITVASFLTIDKSGEYATLADNGTYSYKNRDVELSIVSAYFPDNSNVVKLSLSDSGYAIKYVFSDEKQSNLLFLRVPNTLTELPSRIVQATQIIDFVSPDDALYQSLSPTSFYDCQNLRSVDIPRNVTTIYSNGHPNNGHTFYRCTKLTDVYFAPNSQLETIQNYAFSNCKALKEITIPNSVISLGSQMFWDCSSLETVRLGANQGKDLESYNVQSMLYGCSALKYVYISNTLVPTAGSHLFYSGASGMVFFYTGTYGEYEALNVTLTTLGNNGKFTGATPIEWNSENDDQFYKDLASNEKKNYIVYGYNSCNAFYGGEHSLSEIEEMRFVSFYETITFASNCENGCGKAIINEEKTVAPLFTCIGYSAPEKGKGGIAVGYAVNSEATAKYTRVTGKALKYGVFAVLQERLGNGDVFGTDGATVAGAISAEVSNFGLSVFEIKIVGFDDSQKDIKLAIGAYVAVTNDETTEYSYLQAGAPNEGEKYCFVSYNDIV